MSALRPAGSTRRWRRLRLAVLERDGWRCQLPADVDQAEPLLQLRAGAGQAPELLCGAYADHVDHVVPRAHGGTDALDNLRAACARHNLARGARLDDSPTRPETQRRPRRWEW